MSLELVTWKLLCSIGGIACPSFFKFLEVLCHFLCIRRSSHFSSLNCPQQRNTFFHPYEGFWGFLIPFLWTCLFHPFCSLFWGNPYIVCLIPILQSQHGCWEPQVSFIQGCAEYPNWYGFSQSHWVRPALGTVDKTQQRASHTMGVCMGKAGMGVEQAGGPQQFMGGFSDRVVKQEDHVPLTPRKNPGYCSHSCSPAPSPVATPQYSGCGKQSGSLWQYSAPLR